MKKENQKQYLNQEQEEAPEKLENSKKQDKKVKKILISILIILALILVLLCLYRAGVDYHSSSSSTGNTTEGVCEGKGMISKPIIYLYPTEETKVSVILGNANLITHSYPEYTTGWNVLANPNGDLLDLTTNGSLYSLYYESTNAIEFKVEDEGFVIAGEDTAEFLEEKLAILGLNEREAEEFIIYWLPKLEENEYNYIRFATSDEINENMPLNIDPEPDTLIRILMTYKRLDEPIEVEEQILGIPERTGFVAVEWGGTEIE